MEGIPFVSEDGLFQLSNLFSIHSTNLNSNQFLGKICAIIGIKFFCRIEQKRLEIINQIDSGIVQVVHRIRTCFI